MTGDGLGTLVDAWAVGWSALLAAGYLAEIFAWSGMRALRERGTFRLMLLSTGAVVAGLALAGVREQGAMLAAWAVICASVKLLCDSLAATD